jgi:hypothetical protein
MSTTKEDGSSVKDVICQALDNAGLVRLGGAPDLVLTQLLIETITVVIVVLVFRRLPRTFATAPRHRAGSWQRRAFARRAPSGLPPCAQMGGRT